MSNLRYNQVPHLTQDTTWEGNNTIDITNKSKEVSPYPAGDHKAAMNRRESMRNTRHKSQMILKRSTAFERSVKYFTGGLKSELLFKAVNLFLECLFILSPLLVLLWS